MKKRTIKLLALLFVIAMLCGLLPTTLTSTAAEDNLLVNGDFETGSFSGWTVPSWCASGVKVGDAYAKSGRYGVSISGGWANVNQTVAVDPNTDYELSFWVKGYAVVYFKTVDGKEIHTVWPATYGEWTRVTYTVNVGNNTALYTEISCGEDSALVDGVKLMPMVDTVPTGGLGSVSERDGWLGVAFRFRLKAQVTAADHHFVGGTVVPYGNNKEYPLVRMGAVVTNRAAFLNDLTLDCVNGTTCRDIEAKLVTDVTADSVTYAVRVVNIPDAAKDFAVYARPYYVYKKGDGEVVVYAPMVYEESYCTIADRINYTDSSR